MTIPSMTDIVCGVVPSFPGDGPTAGIGGARIPVDCYTPDLTPGDELESVTGGGVPAPATTPPVQQTSTVSLVFEKGKVYDKTVDAQGITADQLVKAVLDVNHYDKDALSLKNCESLGTVQVNYNGRTMTLPAAHMAIDFKIYKAQWVIAFLPAVRNGNNVEIKWALIPHTKNPEGTFSGSFAGKVNQYSSFHYLTYDVGGWKLEDGKLTYWVSSDPTGLIWPVTGIANNQGLTKNLEKMIELAKKK